MTLATGEIEALLGHQFDDRDLLRHAMTHPSLEGETNYQRLEFLGDRVVSLVIADELLRRYPEDREGVLSRRLTNLVRREAMAGIALAMKLGPHIRMSAATETGGGRENPAVLSDVLEALIGAVYLDGGFDAVAPIVTRLWSDTINGGGLARKDAKSALQEWAQARGLPTPTYELVGREGPDHCPVFRMRVQIEGQGTAEASGLSKRVAEQDAADALLRKMSEQEE